jgi:tetrapyrrole methylase family protein / MazG family protein
VREGRSKVKEFNELLETVDRLLAPGGCPWDQKQTMISMRSSILEEVCEVIEAIDLNDNEHIQEELGDLFFNLIFLCRLAEKENRFRFPDVLNGIAKKLLERHPHVFGSVKIESVEEVLNQWESIKKNEKGKEHREGIFDSIPKGLPSLARAQKIIKRMGKTDYHYISKGKVLSTFTDEESLGLELLEIVARSTEMGIDSEQALKKAISTLERSLNK